MELLVPCWTPLQALVGFLQPPPPNPPSLLGGAQMDTTHVVFVGTCPSPSDAYEAVQGKLAVLCQAGKCGERWVCSVREEGDNGAGILLEAHGRQGTQATAREILPKYSENNS